MGRPKKRKYEYVPSQDLYRYREKNLNGGKAITARTEELLQAKIDRIREEEAQGLDVRYNPTFAEYSSHWLNLHSAEIRPCTEQGYEISLRLHIVPEIGDLPLKKLTADDIKAMLNSMSGYGKSTVNTARAIVKLVLDAAVENNIIPANPMPKKKSIGQDPKPKPILTEEQFQKLLDVTKGTQAETFIMLGYYTGMRKEEILALTWENVHLKANQPYISVRKAWHSVKGNTTVTTQLKTPAAKRDIPIPRILFDYLDHLPRNCEYLIHKNGSFLGYSQSYNLLYIIKARQTGPAVVRSHTGKPSVKVHRQLGDKVFHSDEEYCIDFPFSPHMLRRTYVSNLIRNGVDPKTVQYLAGHASSGVTMDIYAQYMYNQPSDIGDTINSVFKDN